MFIKWEALEYVFMLRRDSGQISWVNIQGEMEITDGAWRIPQGPLES